MMFRFTFEGRDAAVVDVRTSAIFGQTYRPMRVREAGTLVGSAHTFNFANGGTGSFDVTVVDGVATIDVNASGGGGGDGYNHTQNSASTTWTVNHNLGRVPVVEVRSVGGVLIEADVTHTSNNQTVIQFATAQTGTARFV